MTSEIIRRIIETTLDRLGREAAYDDYIHTAHELFPEEMAKLASGFTRQGFIKWLKDGMRQAANVDEADPQAPMVQLDLLPGFPAPAYLNIGSDTEPRLLRFADSRAEDIRLAIEKRNRKRAQIGARIEDLEQKLEWLLENQRDKAETVGQVCARLSGRNEPPPAEPRDGPHRHV